MGAPVGGSHQFSVTGCGLQAARNGIVNRVELVSILSSKSATIVSQHADHFRFPNIVFILVKDPRHTGGVFSMRGILLESRRRVLVGDPGFQLGVP